MKKFNVLSIVLIILLLLSTFDFAKAKTEEQQCELYVWGPNGINVIWRAPPSDGINYIATFLIENLDTKEKFPTATTGWTWYGANLMMNLTYNFNYHNWKVSSLSCIETRPDGSRFIISFITEWIRDFRAKLFLPLVRSY